MPIRLDIRGSNFSGRSIVFAIPEFIMLLHISIRCFFGGGEIKSYHCSYNHMDYCFHVILITPTNMENDNTEEIWHDLGLTYHNKFGMCLSRPVKNIVQYL